MKLSIAAVLVLMLALASSPTRALDAAQVVQAVVGPHPGAAFPLLLLPRVQRDLKLSSDQIQQIQKQDQSIQRLAEPEPDAQEPPTEAQLQQIAVNQAKLRDMAVTTLLDRDQLRRLEQILLQVRGPGLLLNKDVAAYLELTPTQQQAVRTTLQNAAGKRKALMTKEQPVDVASYRKRAADLQALQAETDAKALAILNLIQHQKWNELLGPHLSLTAAQN